MRSNRIGSTMKYEPLHKVLCNPSYVQSYKLKNRLIKAGLLEQKCYNCNLIEWLGKPIPLELEHKDGNKQNCCFSNLTLLCPNCHAITPTYRGKNKRLLRIKSRMSK